MKLQMLSLSGEESVLFIHCCSIVRAAWSCWTLWWADIAEQVSGVVWVVCQFVFYQMLSAALNSCYLLARGHPHHAMAHWSSNHFSDATAIWHQASRLTFSHDPSFSCRARYFDMPSKWNSWHIRSEFVLNLPSTFVYALFYLSNNM